MDIGGSNKTYYFEIKQVLTFAKLKENQNHDDFYAILRSV